MKKRFTAEKSVPNFFMFATIFIAVTIPLIVIKLSGEESFNMSEKAYDTESPSISNPCVIFFPKVNPKTLEVNGTYDVSVEAISSIKDIKGIEIVDDSGNTLFEKDYPSLTASVEESFVYSPKQIGSDFIRGVLKKVTGEKACSGSYVTIINKNTAPQITSKEENADISVGDSFEYTISAKDIDGDIVNFAYSFTPRADWLKKVIIEDGTDGTIKIKLQGTPDKPASYLAHIFVHDGYSNHLNSMAWVINVSQKENDIPVVKILNPSQDISTNIGAEIYTKWLASDLNQIIKYQIYLSKDPTDTNEWTAINENISYKTREYNVNTSSFSEGIYRVIIKAVDNQSPAGIGFAISPKIILKQKEATEEPSDHATLPKPQIINITPNNSAEIENPTPIIRATLIAGKNATVNEESISFSLNGKIITEGIRLNKISEKEITFIYQPKDNLNPGIQKISLSFTDSNGNKAEKEWTFTLINTTEEEKTDMLKIFGIEINRKIALIIGAGIIVVLLAIFIPIVIYKTWSKDSEDYSQVKNKELPPKIPSSPNMYDLKTDVNIAENKQISTEKKKEDSIIFTTPTLEDTKETMIENTKAEAPIIGKDLTEENTLESTAVQENNQENIKSEDEVQIMPDLEIPTPETFTNQEQKAEASSKSVPVMDEITKLYEEIQKVGEENTKQSQGNS